MCILRGFSKWFLIWQPSDLKKLLLAPENISLSSVGIELGWEELKGVEKGIAALTNLFLDSRLLQEFRSVSWLPKEPDKSYVLRDLKKAIAKENHRALRVLCHFLNLCASILQLVRSSIYCEWASSPTAGSPEFHPSLGSDPCCWIRQIFLLNNNSFYSAIDGSINNKWANSGTLSLKGCSWPKTREDKVC